MMRILHGMLLIGTALSLVVPSAYVAGPAILSIAGLFLMSRAGKVSPITDPAIRAAWKALLAGFAAFALTGLFLNLYHGDTDPGAYERLFPFIFLPAMVWTIRAGGWSALPWIASLGIGAVFAGLHASWEYLMDPAVRATGATGNAIKFGNSAALLASFCVLAALYIPSPRHITVWRAGLLVAALFGAQASVLSGSKGGWPVLVLVVAIFIYETMRSGDMRTRLLLAVVTLGLVFVALTLSPTHMVKDRIISGVNGALHWFETGGEVTEGSVSIRFELWSVGLDIFARNPFLGAGVEGKDILWEELANSGRTASTVGLLDTTSAHNDLIDTLAQGGLLGGTGHVLAFLGAWLAFWRLCNHADRGIAALARMGLFATLSYAIFGIAVSVFWMSIFRSTFAAFTLILLALITVQSARIARSTAQTP